MPATDRLKSALASQYSIEREIGAGGMATVYLARDLKHDREVALKVLRADLSAVLGTERFLSEVRIAARLDHPHILTLIDSGEAGGILYYVLPYVRGESLRARLERERQLPVDEALSITSQVASALDYAHGKGVVHRDIKPENILLHEGEAVLADFGIALAVKEASGNRMTETGLSLGTPQYMSPEQATGDRNIDKRSDIYSLGAVFYEMIAGEPPVTGVSAQAVIAKLMTEKPVRLRVVRDSISEEMDRATAKALAKVPADRFASAGEYVRALALAPPVTRARSGWLTPMRAVAAGVIVAVLASGIWLARDSFGTSSGSVVRLGDRTQVTFTGRVTGPTMTEDGKTLAYIVTNCGKAGCRYGVEMQDVGGSSSRRIFDGATALYGIRLSADRRNLLFFGTVNERFGSFIVSTLGGQPRFLTAGNASLWANGDSLVFNRATRPAETFWLLFSGLDGVPRDSVMIRGKGDQIVNVGPVPGSNWFVLGLVHEGQARFIAVDRKGKLGGESRPDRANFFGASVDAIWISTWKPGVPTQAVVRVPFNSESGAFGSRGDTLYSGLFTGIDVTPDGRQLVMDQGSTEYSLWKLPFADALKGNFPDDARVLRTTSAPNIRMSRDGSHIVISRGAASGPDGREWVTIPFDSRTETPVPGRHLSVSAIDSVTLEFVDKTASGVEFSRWDRRTGRRSAVFAVADSNSAAAVGLPDDGWAWIPTDRRSIHVHRRGQGIRKYSIPPWFVNAYQMVPTNDGQTLLFGGWNVEGDSAGIGLLRLSDGNVTQIAAMPGEGAFVVPLNDGSLLVNRNDTPESSTFFIRDAAGRMESLGSIPRPLMSFSTSRDMRRFVAVSREYKGDAWISRVVTR